MGEVLVALDEVGLEAVSEQMAFPGVALVEALRVPPVEESGAGAELDLGCLDHEVVVVSHQAEDVDVPVEAGGGDGEEVEEAEAVFVVAVDVAAVDPECRDMENAIR